MQSYCVLDRLYVAKMWGRQHRNKKVCVEKPPIVEKTGKDKLRCTGCGLLCVKYTNREPCCNPGTPCKIGEGNCRTDADCQKGLFCGTNNCHVVNGHAKWAKWAFGFTDDCCTDRHHGFWEWIGR